MNYAIDIAPSVSTGLDGLHHPHTRGNEHSCREYDELLRRG